jgi:predicted protein tyrosine phosphatase
MSRSDAEHLPPLPGVAVISITAPEKAPATLGEFSHILRLSFADVDFLFKDITNRATKKHQEVFTSVHAAAVKSFVQTLPTEIASIVVHCEGGFSRSCAIALALNQIYGYKVDHHQMANANPSIVKTMLAENSKKKR